jgi:bifunctional DNA-binding transcriptional regulator/antitoxin component of YhaV-PrlF toxin-antitoxin module
MKEVRIVAIDNRGRIVIPQIIRKSLGLVTDSQLMMISDSEIKEIRITPIGLANEKQLIKFRITMRDEAGALAKIATVFANHGISLIHGESITVKKEKTAIWTVIGPTPENITLEELKEVLINEGSALKMDVLPLE